MELSRQIASFGETCEGLEQYAVQRFAKALEVVPRILADNTGVKSSRAISKILAAHQEGQANAAFNIESDGDPETLVCDAKEKSILDLLLVKHWGIKYATDAACTILKVDQIIMAKRAGGPKPKQGGGPMDEGDDY